MKKIFFFLLASTFLFLQTGQAQTADEILQKYFENTGGLENWKSLKSMKMTIKTFMQGMDLTGTVYEKAPNKQRTEISVQDKQIVQAYDGTDAWWINPFTGSDAAQKMPDEMAEQMKDHQFESEFMDYTAKGHTVELEGSEMVEGTETYKIKLTKKSGDVEYHFFDKENYVPILVKTYVKSGPSQGTEAETYLSDYQEVGNLIIPFFIEVKSGGQSFQKITMENIMLNEELDDSLFSFPK